MSLHRMFLALAARFWPGLPALWSKGDVHSLLLSILFGWLLGFAWLATFVWPKWLTTMVGHSWFDSLALVGLWLLLFGLSAVSGLRFAMGGGIGSSDSDRLQNLAIAQEYYLQANYFESERHLRKNMRNVANDVESQLLWISVLRRTKRISQALTVISDVELLDAAIPWTAELHVEKERCMLLKRQTPPAHE
jgi:hypothetical protein